MPRNWRLTVMLLLFVQPMNNSFPVFNVVTVFSSCCSYQQLVSKVVLRHRCLWMRPRVQHSGSGASHFAAMQAHVNNLSHKVYGCTGVCGCA